MQIISAPTATQSCEPQNNIRLENNNTLTKYAPQSTPQLMTSEIDHQIFYKCGIRYQLREAKKDTPQPLIAIVTVNGIRAKIATGMKVKKMWWNQKLQCCILYPNMTKLDVHNASTANTTIQRLNFVISKYFQYLCNNPRNISSISEVKEGLQNIFNHYKIKSTMRSINKTTENQLNIGFLKILSSKVGSTHDQYRVHLKKFKEFVNKKGVPFSFESMSYDLIYDFARELENTLSYGTASNCLGFILYSLKILSQDRSNNFSFSSLGLADIRINRDKYKVRTKEDKAAKRIIVTNEQMQALHNMQLTPRDSAVRDCFLLQCKLGFRYSDLPLILDKTNFQVVEGQRFISYTPEKQRFHNSMAQAPLDLFPRAFELWEKLAENQVHILHISKFNKHLKTICRASGAFDNEIEFTDERGNKQKKHEYELISSHSARHTFITRCATDFQMSPNDTIKFTGHTSEDMINEVYTHHTAQTKAKAAAATLQRIMQKTEREASSTIPTDDNPHYIQGIEQAKEICNYLNAPRAEWIGENDITRLCMVIGRYEGKIVDKFGNQALDAIKEFFNMRGSIEERVFKLHSYLSTLPTSNK